jgi:NAD(P)-dependent dehydrogenase (short-subunit alcohol dehydrogenase family)
MSQALIAFIIGAGKNVGEHTAAALKGKGYQVVLGSRGPVIDQVKKDGYFPVAVNVGDPESVKRAFAQINKELGPPNVVIFNGKYITALSPTDG